MRKYNPYKNIFYYYRGPGSKKHGDFDKQIEDNTTKALINTLEKSRKNILKSFLKLVDINVPIESKVILYDLQVSEKFSRPDGLIQIADQSVYIESKIDAPLEREQLERHLQSIDKGYLLCITPREKDFDLIKKMRDNRLRFITWEQIFHLFKSTLPRIKDVQTRFVLTEFLEYLEVINMAPFTGWQKKDFEAFLFIENDPNNELRLRVKEKFRLYIEELNSLLKEKNIINTLEPYVGKLGGKDVDVWGSVSEPPVNKKVHKPHFSAWINSYEFEIGVQIEGKTPANKMKQYIGENKSEFLRILRRLEGFKIELNERVEIQPQVHNFRFVAKIQAGKHCTENDVNYLLEKMNQYNLFAFHIGKSFSMDDEKIQSQKFLKTSMRIIKQLMDYYNFAWGRK
ncbi:hypothetical protein KAU32_01570 [bacterium]|nr:hypothetical protein [bacterium]